MLGLLIPVWGRPELSSRVLSYWAGPSFDFCHRVAVVSPEDPNPPVIPSAFHVVEHENRVGGKMHRKWQAGLDAMPSAVDSVMMMGSDDLATEGLVRLLRTSALERGMAYPGSIYWYNEKTGEIVHGSYRTVFAGCTYSMDVVRRVKGPLFVPESEEAEWAPDVVSSMKARPLVHSPFRAPDCHELGEAVVDIKSGENVWSWDYVANKARRVMRNRPSPEAEEFFGTHFPGFVFSPEQTGTEDGLQAR